MLCRSFIALFVLVLWTQTTLAQNGDKTVTGPLDFKMKNIDGKELDLASFKGKVVLLVNVASECGYTPQYVGLQKLYEQFAKDGLVVVGVPSNDFGSQESGSNDDIKKFCESRYKVTFPMLAKVPVAGAKQTPLYAFLTSEATNPGHAGAVRWNFEKFLIGHDGQVRARFASDAEPDGDELMNAIRRALAK